MEAEHSRITELRCPRVAAGIEHPPHGWHLPRPQCRRPHQAAARPWRNCCRPDAQARSFRRAELLASLWANACRLINPWPDRYPQNQLRPAVTAALASNKCDWVVRPITGPNPRARQARCRPLVALFTATAWGTSMASDKACSKPERWPLRQPWTTQNLFNRSDVIAVTSGGRRGKGEPMRYSNR